MSRGRVLIGCAGSLAALVGVLVAVKGGAVAGDTLPALPPRGGAVVFESEFGLYAANADGTALTRLTSGEYDHEAVWSPDATSIAFARIAQQDDPVLVMNTQGTGLRQVGSGDSPAWSPDGSRIAFANDGIVVVNPDGTGATTVVDRADLGFSWSPDGTKIAYSDGGDPARIRVVDVSSGTSAPLGTSTFERAWRLAWSPDGTAIAFDGLYEDGGLQLVDAATGRVRKLTGEVDAFTPVWSPDSSRIAFIRDGDLLTIGRDGGDERRLASVGELGAGGTAASWISDGSFLVYQRQRFPGSSDTDVWRVNADGTGARPITRAFPTGASYAGPQWAATTVASVPDEPAAMISLRPSRTLRTNAPTVELSADEARVAVVTAGNGGCGMVGISSLRGAVRWLAGSGECGDAAELWGVALAGTRAAWMYEEDTNTLHYTVLVTGRPGSRARELTSADHDRNAYLGNLAGDGSLLVYNTWKQTGRARVAIEPALWRVSVGATAHRRLVLAGPDAHAVVSVDAGRIATLRRDGTLVIVNDRGKRLSAFRLGRRGFRAARLTGPRLVVLRGTTIEVRDASRGTVKHRWPIAPSIAPITLHDAQGDFAVYTAGIAIHLLRLSDGRERVLEIARQAGPADADLERAGLYYSYNESDTASPGRIAFVRFRDLASSFR